MRRIFRLRTLAIVAVVGVAIGLTAAARRRATPAPPYPDPWVNPATPSVSDGEASEPAGTPSTNPSTNGVSGEVGEPAGS